jgi:tRNA (guanine10-N2)-dimethyltransferase
VLVLDAPIFDPRHLEILGSRAALVRTISEIILSGPADEAGKLVAKADSLEWGPFFSNVGPASKRDCFGVRPKRMGGQNEHVSCNEIAGDLGALIKKQTGLNVDLKDPDVWFDLIVSSEIHITRRLLDVERRSLEYRKGHYRPFFSPISIHPKYARASVNIARARDNFLDPFCGTGGFLIEGSQMGLAVFGSDLDPEMIAGSRKNLEGFGAMRFHLEKMDIGDSKGWGKHPEYPKGGFDAVITDPPYGRASTTMGEETKRLYTRAFETLGPLIRPGGRLLMILPEKKDQELAAGLFELERAFELYVHKSLTRYYCLFKGK